MAPLFSTSLDPGAIERAADDVAARAGGAHELTGAVTSAHAPAVDGVAGLLAGPMRTAAASTRQPAERTLQSIVFSAGALRLWAQHVTAYKTGLAKLNEEWETAGDADLAALKARLASRKAALDDMLDAHAADVAGLLDRGPDDATAVRELYGEGVLPVTAPSVFSDVNLSSAAIPVHARAGRETAGLILRTLNGVAEPGEFHRATTLLDAVAEQAVAAERGGEALPGSEIDYLEACYGTLDSDLWRASEPAAEDAMGTPKGAALAALGTGLLALSNGDALPGGQRRSGGFGRLPETVRTLVQGRARHHEGTDVQAPADLATLGVMAGAADPVMTGGARFSREITMRVAEIAGMDGDSSSGPAQDAMAATLRDLLGVSTRNAVANHGILVSEDGHHVLSRIYGHAWGDGGETAAQLTDWIPAYAASEDEDERALAGQAAAGLIALVAGARQAALFRRLLDSRGEEANPVVLRSLAEVAATYLRSFAAEDPGETAFADGELLVEHGTRRRLFRLIAQDDAAGQALTAAVHRFLKAAGLPPDDASRLRSLL